LERNCCYVTDEQKQKSNEQRCVDIYAHRLCPCLMSLRSWMLTMNDFMTACVEENLSVRMNTCSITGCVSDFKISKKSTPKTAILCSEPRENCAALIGCTDNFETKNSVSWTTEDFEMVGSCRQTGHFQLLYLCPEPLCMPRTNVHAKNWQKRSSLSTDIKRLKVSHFDLSDRLWL
jgi:hypothetical protein